MSEENYRPSRKELFKLGAGAAGLAGLSLLGGEAAAQTARGRSRLRPDVQVLLERRPELLRGKRFWLITNPISRLLVSVAPGLQP